jgi:uncharacterized protein (DUF1330 family)
MSVYVIIDITITDEMKYTEYINCVYDIVVKYGGRYKVRGGECTSMSGDWHPQRMVVIEFPDRQAVRDCFNSSEYRVLAQLRKQSTYSRAVIVDGFSAKDKGG